MADDINYGQRILELADWVEVTGDHTGIAMMQRVKEVWPVDLYEPINTALGVDAGTFRCMSRCPSNDVRREVAANAAYRGYVFREPKDDYAITSSEHAAALRFYAVSVHVGKTGYRHMVRSWIAVMCSDSQKVNDTLGWCAQMRRFVMRLLGVSDEKAGA